MPKQKGFTIDFDNTMKVISKHKKLLTLAVLGILLFFIGVSSGLIPLQSSPSSNVVNSGFEGAKCYLSYVNLQNTFPSDWSGTSVNHYLAVVDAAGDVVNVAETGNFISHSAADGSYDHVFWSSPQVSNPVISWLQNRGITDWYGSQTLGLRTDIQSNVPLSYVDANGEPLGGNTSTLVLNYPSIISTPKPNSDGSYTYQVVNQKLLMIPADFVIQFSIPTSPSGITSSKWSEGDWQNVRLMFMLYWNTWLSTLLNDPRVQTDIYAQNLANATKILENGGFQYAGGFPLTAWIGGWDPVVLPTGSTFGTPVSGTGSSDPVYTYKGNSPPQKISDTTMENLIGKAQVSPDLTGHTIDLLSDKNAVILSKNVQSSNDINDLLTAASLHTPDPTMTPTQYFEIDISDLGTYADGNIIAGWTVYYPCTYMRVHVVYGVWGNFTYLWTTQTEQQQNYPGYQNRTITVVTGGGLGLSFGWPDLFSPLNLEIFAILIIATILLITVFNPGVWSAIFSNRKQSGQGQKPKSSGG